MDENTLTLNININDGTSAAGNISNGTVQGSDSNSGGVLSSIRGFYSNAKNLLNTTGVALVASSAINYTTSRVGITTGNYQKQQEITANKQVAGQLAAVGVSTLMGGVGAGLLAAAGIGLSYYYAYDSYNFNRRAESAQLAIQREREGLITSSRSRSAIQ